MSYKAKPVSSAAAAEKRTTDWIFNQEIPSDIIVEVGGVTFTLHKFLLVSRCGFIRKMVAESEDTDVAYIEITDSPGGAEAFELAAKFCYGINFEISTENIAMLRCVAEYLEMSEDYAIGNLIGRAEAYINEVVAKNLSGAVTVLQQCEKLYPMSERVKLVSRCIDAVAYLAYQETRLSSSGITDSQDSLSSSVSLRRTPVMDWWAEDLSVLRIDTFQRVIIAMKAREFPQSALGPVLMLFAQKSLRGLEIFGKGKKTIEPKQEHEKRVMVETIVSLLPRERNSMSVSFLSMLLRAAIYLETTIACRLDLEKRMGLQLGQAVLDDLLIPSYSFTGDTMYDVDAVRRILMNYLERDILEGYNGDDEYLYPMGVDMDWVGRLLDNYLAEISTDPKLTVTKFVGLIELIPEQAKISEDGIYRAIDIYLKAHPTLSDSERKKICSMMDCQRLSREACAHAAQNERLPVQTVVQVLYFEQQRIRETMNTNVIGGSSPAINKMMNAYGNHIGSDTAGLRRENEDLKLELVKMRMRLNEVGKSSTGTSNHSGADKPPTPRKSFVNSVSKTLGRLNPFSRIEFGGKPGDNKVKPRPSKNRRHSIS